MKSESSNYVAFEPHERGHIVHLHSSSGQLHKWRVRGTRATPNNDASMRELVEACGEDAVVCFNATILAELLSHPGVLPISRPLLGRLCDLSEVAPILLPLEREYRLQLLAPDPPGDDLPPSLAHTRALHERVLAVLDKASGTLLDMLKVLLGQDAAFTTLPWPDAGPDALAFTRIGDVLQRMPRGRQKDTRRADIPGDVTEISVETLSPGGRIEQVHPAYEHRAGQVEMAQHVADALRDGRYLLVEAGTGVGKSLAYLIPAALWARSEGEPVIVSTNTKNLQEQLIRKDLPLLHQALPVDFEAVLLKGRRNYPCIRAVVSAAVDASNSLFKGERLAAAYIISWLAQCESGDLGEVSPHALELIPEIPHLITGVRSQAEGCAGRSCSHFDNCPLQIARAWARRADIVISNHALTFEDTHAQILPTYSRIIFDEAHNIENVATDNLSLECSTYSLNQLLRSIEDEPAGFVETMNRRLEELQSTPERAFTQEALDEIAPLTEDFGDAAKQFGEILYDFCFLASSDQRGNADRASARLVQEVRDTDEWREVLSLGEATVERGFKLLGAVEVFAGHLASLDKGNRPGAEAMDADAEGLRVRVNDNLQALTTVLRAKGDQSEYVTWAEAWTSRFGASWSLRAAPVDIGPILADALYKQKEAIIFTSATISVDGGFSYFRQRLGLDEYHERLDEIGVPSPFDLKEQLLLCVPNDMPEPNEAGFSDAVTGAVGRICEATEGGALVLFTARNRMLRAFKELEPDLRAMDLEPLCQDVSGPRTALLDRLKGNDRAVLFGLKSFWEGVDVPGDALRCVIICKLPFAVPSDPIIQARQEDVARKGLNPMLDYYIPESIIGFKQGFGRLIRTTTDTGVVFVLDRRILTKGYGRRFFQSIQRCELSRESLDDCISRTTGWLGYR